MQRWLFIACLFCLAALPAFAVEGSGDGTPSMTGDQSKVIRHVGMLQAACIFWRTADLGITERLRRKLERNRQRCGSGMERR